MENRENQGQEVFVTKDMNLSEIIMSYPEAAPILMGYGLHCVGCHLSGVDTLESGAKIHAMDEETLNMMIRDINVIIRECKEDENSDNLSNSAS